MGFDAVGREESSCRFLPLCTRKEGSTNAQLPLNKVMKPRAACLPDLGSLCFLRCQEVILRWAILWGPQSTQGFGNRALLTRNTQAGSQPSTQAALLGFLVLQEGEGRKCNGRTLIRKKEKQQHSKRPC